MDDMRHWNFSVLLCAFLIAGCSGSVLYPEKDRKSDNPHDRTELPEQSGVEQSVVMPKKIASASNFLELAEPVADNFNRIFPTNTISEESRQKIQRINVRLVLPHRKIKTSANTAEIIGATLELGYGSLKRTLRANSNALLNSVNGSDIISKLNLEENGTLYSLELSRPDTAPTEAINSIWSGDLYLLGEGNPIYVGTIHAKDVPPRR